MDKISNKYLLKEIFSYIKLNKFLNIIKKNKKYQKALDIPLFTYQSIYLFKKLKIDYDTINNDKLYSFITDEFKIKVDKALFVKMIEEKKVGEAIMPINHLSINKNQELKILNKDINWISDINIIKLDLIRSNPGEQIIIPSGLFPNLKILNVNNNFITPSSLIIPLCELCISCNNTNENILFLNDINKEEVNLNNLEILEIFTYGRKKKNLLLLQKKEEIPKTNNIIFRMPKIKYLKIIISCNCENSFIEKYFNLNLLEIIESNQLDKKRTTFIDLINKKEKYFKTLSMKDLNNIIISYSSQDGVEQSLHRTFAMNTTINGLRKYSYYESHFNADARICEKICLGEKFEEKKNGNKILKSYTNCRDYNNIGLNLTNIDDINAITINGNGRKINADKINGIFNIKKNNYSLEEINLSFQGNGFIGENYYKNLLKNISKFKVLKKLFLYDHISIEKFKLLLDKISKFKLLEEIDIRVDAKSCNNIKGLKNSIKKIFPLCNVEMYDFCFLRVKQINQNNLKNRINIKFLK